ncbi:hypothetical protein EIN_066230 [Entamoeba invadens IP1]|uniref:Auxin efflux carrier family protein n=1 Tax=Entamoeba invadens IP1 TaxID=370355 RepID=A0A0A1U0B5_ENTIV|nr:hypothetical protein EIN_066230 [Entamoeba invadens IP1]ELP84328.1 hypothetical protein EIN_066230 [Entamoeba invadens IP1]|eukprot:XP_004183674.1 hypothetical protein EIN_066230 [Entamoeba invadens IP1]
MDIFGIILSTFNAIFKLAIVAVTGFLATRTAGFDVASRRVYSSIVFQYFVPAVIFAQTATSMDRVSTLVDWWYLPLCAVVINAIAFPSIFIVAKLFRLEHKTTRVFVYTISFSNTMYIPLALVDSMTSENNEVFGPNAKEVGGGYICTFLLAATVIYWIFGYSFIQRNQVDQDEEERRASEIELKDETQNEQLDVKTLEKALESSQNVLEKKELKVSSGVKEDTDLSTQLIADEESPMPKVSDELNLNTTTATVVDDQKPLAGVQEASESQRDRCGFLSPIKVVFSKVFGAVSYVWQHLPVSVKRALKNLCTPPTIATLLGVILILAYPVRDMLFNQGKMAIIGRTAKYLGSAAVISALFILGGNLSTGPKGGTIKWYVIAVGLFVRMVICPAICIGINFALWYYGIVPSDPMFFFVLCVESSTPPALNSAIVMNIVYPKGNEECASLLFWAYLCSIVTLSGWLVVTLMLIEMK